MIYPTRRAVLIAAGIAPAALVIALFAPAWWTAGLALVVLLVTLCGVDALAGAATRQVSAACEGPGVAGVGEEMAMLALVRFAGRAPAPAFAEAALDVEGPAAAPAGWRAPVELDGGEGAACFALTSERRGTVRLTALWLRWPGPLGLVWKQRRLALDRAVLVLPDIRPVRADAARIVSRDALHGMIAQLQLGEGAEFEALADYRQGMDRRAIDWKQSARHTRLIAKEYRTERNHNVVMALDSGRAMCEPVAGVPRIDRAASAALLAAWVALKEGDRVGFFAFDSRPRAASAPISGPRAFPMLQRIAAGIDYSDNETNYTLALATLASGIARRSLVVVFTEFTDTISAELMLAALGPLLRRHVVLFVVPRDEELESFVAAEPVEADDVSRAVTAAALLRERGLVLTRLRHLGVHVVEAAASEAGPALVRAYLDIKRRSLL